MSFQPSTARSSTFSIASWPASKIQSLFDFKFADRRVNFIQQQLQHEQSTIRRELDPSGANLCALMIDQINGLTPNNARFEIARGDTPTRTIVVARRAPALPVHLLVAHENQDGCSNPTNRVAATPIFDNTLT